MTVTDDRLRLVTRMAADQRTRVEQERLAKFCVMFARAHRKLAKGLDAEARTKPYVGFVTADVCELRDLMGDAVELLGRLREEMAEREGVVRLPDALRFVRERQLTDLIIDVHAALGAAVDIDNDGDCTARRLDCILDALEDAWHFLSDLRERRAV